MQPTPKTYWPTASELETDPPDSSSHSSSTVPGGAFQESYFERLIRVRSLKEQQFGSNPPPDSALGLTVSPTMSAPTAIPSMPGHPWQNTPLWTFGQQPAAQPVPFHIPASTPIAPAPVPRPTPAPAGPSVSRFDQLLRAKLAAEKKNAPTSSAAPVYAAPAGFDAALAKLQTADTVVNRSFIAPQYNTPQVVVQKPKPSPRSPAQPSSSNLPPPPTFYGYPMGNNSPMPVSPQQPVPTPLSPTSFDQGALGSEQMAANFRSMVALRINNMYASAQMQGMSRQAPELPMLQVPDNQSVYGSLPGSPVSPFSAHSPQFQANYPLVPSPTIPQDPTTPSFQFSQWSDPRGSIDSVKLEPEWSTGPVNPPCQPFLLNITPPQNVDMAGHANHTPYCHSASSSIDSSFSVSPVTPQFGPFPSFGTPIDVKPIISPALSTVTLPDDQVIYRRYSRGLLVPMNARPQFKGASSGEGSNGGGDMPYNLGGHDDGFDGSNGLNGLDFGDGGLGNGNGGSGGEEGGEDGNGDDGDQNGDDPGKPSTGRAPRGKKLPLACHFCRRRKLKCDGIKPICENCQKRNIECTYDNYVRRRGPGKRTKPRDRNGEAIPLEYDPSGIEIPQEAYEHQHDSSMIPELDHTEHVEIDHSDLLLDPALAGENGEPARADDVMEAMGALKQAGIDLGLHTDDDGLGEPSTLAELGQLSEEFARQHHVQFGEEDVEEDGGELGLDGRKRKSDLLDFGDLTGLDVEDGLDHKRLRLDDTNGFSEVLAEQQQLQLEAEQHQHEHEQQLQGDDGFDIGNGHDGTNGYEEQSVL